MSAFYKRTLTLKAAKDEDLLKLMLERDELATTVLEYDAATLITGTAAAAMGSPDSVDLGAITTVAVLYVEFTGANFKVAVTDANGTSTLTVGAAGVEKVLLLEGTAITALTIQNVDGSTAVPYVIAAFGA